MYLGSIDFNQSRYDRNWIKKYDVKSINKSIK